MIATTIRKKQPKKVLKNTDLDNAEILALLDNIDEHLIKLMKIMESMQNRRQVMNTKLQELKKDYYGNSICI